MPKLRKLRDNSVTNSVTDSVTTPSQLRAYSLSSFLHIFHTCFTSCFILGITGIIIPSYHMLYSTSCSISLWFPRLSEHGHRTPCRTTYIRPHLYSYSSPNIDLDCAPTRIDSLSFIVSDLTQTARPSDSGPGLHPGLQSVLQKFRQDVR